MAEPAPEEIDPDRILNDWALDDLREVMRARCPDSRLWTALHLCGLRRTGRFIDDPAQVPGNALIHLANRLGEEPPVRLLLLPRPATDSAIRARVRDHLGFVPFSADARNRLEAALSEVAADGLTLADLIQRAETALRAAKVILPARTTLDRLVASITRQALDGLFNRIATRLPSSLRVALDRLVGQLADDAGTEGRASLGRYRTPSAASMGRFTREARQRLEEIGAMLAGLPDLADVPERIRRQLAQLCRRYDGHALRGFPPDKRHGLLICFLLDRRQGLLDDMAQAHDNHMTGLMRRARHAAEAEARRLRRAAEDGLLMLVDTGRAVLAGDHQESVAGLRERLGADRLQTAVLACEAVSTQDGRGVIDAVLARYPDLRKSLPAFLSLPFTSDTGRDDLLRAIDLSSITARSGPCRRMRPSSRPAGARCCTTTMVGCAARSGKPRSPWRFATRCARATFICPTAGAMPGSGRWCSTSGCGRAPGPAPTPTSVCPNGRPNTSPI
jgi:hypothetical protein